MRCYSYVAIVFTFFLYACGVSDQRKIIGKWQCDQDWFEYKENGTYDAGKAFITMERSLKYKVDAQKKELVMYTNNPETTYYLQYEWRGNDSLALRNSLSASKTFNVFYRVRKDQ